LAEALVSSIKPVWQEENGKLHLLCQNRKVGFIEALNPSKMKQFDLRQDVWFVELDWNTLQTHFEKQQPRFKALPKFPLMQRDLALIIDRQVSYADVQKSVKLAKSKLLQDVKLFDVFESDKLGEGKKSYAINLSFYNDERTLTDSEVEQEMKQIVSSLEKNLGAAIRGNA
jgi:phenylalanyl-tRNA synthetase beta chain